MTDRPTKGVPRFQIFPAIGVARVGDSRLHTYVASEAPQIDFVPQGGYRGPAEPVAPEDPPGQIGPALTGPVYPGSLPDPSGVIDLPTRRRIKRMGCRFRIYEFDPDGNPIDEITADDADIEWRVQLVNKKATGIADWGYGVTTARLNTATSDARLTIDSGEQTVAGAGAGPVELAGEIMSDTTEARRVKLGDLTTDDKGRLVVYGGHGIAASWLAVQPVPSLIRNGGWYDDTSDGTVKATLTIDGRTVEATTARIVVGPPDYAHPCLAPVTLFDLAFDRSGGWRGHPPETSFTDHIHPILHRSAFLEWTLFAIEGGSYGRTPKHGHGYTGSHDMHPDGAFLDPVVFSTLQVLDPDHSDYETGEARRIRYFTMLKGPWGKTPPGGQGEDHSMPAIEGLTFTETQFEYFRDFAGARFESDWPADRDPGDLGQVPFHRIPPAERPAAMNRAAMDFAVGGPFLPGVEVGAVAADPASYVTLGMSDPEIDFRIADSIEAGALTQSLAVPWQTAFNQPHYANPPGEATADNLWPSARPVLVPAKRGGSSDDMLWTRPLTRTEGNVLEKQTMRRNRDMVDAWSQLGFIAPARFYVEVARTLSEGDNFSM